MTDTNKALNMRLSDMLKWQRSPKGEIGIEVEVEGSGFPDLFENPIANWEYHADGSLRGGAEYVIKNPVSRENVASALDTLAKGLAKAKLKFSGRTSIHVHVNVQRLTLRQWINYIVLYCILEEALVDVVSPERAGNKFCLRFKDAEAPLELVCEMLQSQYISVRDYFGGRNQKYAGMNLQATVGFGTCEFRSMRGNLDTKFINDWAQLLVYLRDVAEKTLEPGELVLSLSKMGPREFIRSVLPGDNTITEAVLNLEGVDQKIMDGVRLAQDVAYAVEWPDPADDFKAEPKKKFTAFEQGLLDQGIHERDLHLWMPQAAPAGQPPINNGRLGQIEAVVPRDPFDPNW